MISTPVRDFGSTPGTDVCDTSAVCVPPVAFILFCFPTMPDLARGQAKGDGNPRKGRTASKGKGEGALERGRKEGEGYRERRVGKGWGGEGNGGRGEGGDGRGGRGAEGVGRRRRTPAPSSDLKPKPCPSASDGGPKRANCGSQV